MTRPRGKAVAGKGLGVGPGRKDIDRPLGQAGEKGRPGFSLSPRGIAAGVVVLAVIGASAAISLRQQPFRTPAAIAVVTPQAAAPANDPVPVAKPVASPSIIHVDPPAAPAEGVVVIRDPSAVGQDLRVAHLPEKALIEQGADGPLPVRAADGRRPVDVYARPWSGARGARIAIVIGGLGVSQTGTQSAIRKLPPEITLAFASQGNSIGRWMQESRRKGHEIVMQLPLEPFDYPNVNPGRNTLTVEAPADKNLENLRWTLSRTTNYTGVMNYMGARFAADPAAMQPVMAELGQRGLLYLDDGSSARSTAPELALENAVPFAVGDTVIDQTRERGAILDKLDELERTARAKGFAIGTGSAFDVTVDAVAAWASEVRKRGIEIVPVSAVVTDPQRG